MAQKRGMSRTVEINWAQRIYSHRRRYLPGQRIHTLNILHRGISSTAVYQKISRKSVYLNWTAVSPICLVATAGSHFALS